MSQIPTKARQGVRKRTNGVCDRCALHGNQIHHRQRRRDGGHGLANLVLLCDTCHRWVHGNPTDAKAAGYIVPVGITDVALVPLHTYAGPVLLNDAGGVTYL